MKLEDVKAYEVSLIETFLNSKESVETVKKWSADTSWPPPRRLFSLTYFQKFPSPPLSPSSNVQSRRHGYIDSSERALDWRDAEMERGGESVTWHGDADGKRDCGDGTTWVEIRGRGDQTIISREDDDWKMLLSISVSEVLSIEALDRRVMSGIVFWICILSESSHWLQQP